VATEKRVWHAFRSVFRVMIATVGVRLPQLNHGVRNSDTVGVEYTTGEKDPLARGAIGRDPA
jgi:hypothetical protein